MALYSIVWWHVFGCVVMINYNLASNVDVIRIAGTGTNNIIYSVEV